MLSTCSIVSGMRHTSYLLFLFFRNHYNMVDRHILLAFLFHPNQYQIHVTLLRPNLTEYVDCARD